MYFCNKCAIQVDKSEGPHAHNKSPEHRGQFCVHLGCGAHRTVPCAHMSGGALAEQLSRREAAFEPGRASVLARTLRASRLSQWKRVRSG